jgi:hypothetical protein
MRHSSLDLTMNVYTDPSLLDVAGALSTLPDLSTGRGHHDGDDIRGSGETDPTGATGE